MSFTLIKPDASGKTTNDVLKLFDSKNNVGIFAFIGQFLGKEYLYWDKVRYKEPSPKGITREDLWAIIKFFRKSQGIKTPILDKKGRAFTWSRLDYFEEFFHNLDMGTGGELFVEKGDVSRANKQKLITRGIMEEAIASSQLEGASTSRKAAKKMLREGRKPRNESEKMIVNNYISMKAIEESYRDREMSMDLILELHGLITKDTRDSEGEIPRMKRKGEVIAVRDSLTNQVYFESPDIGFVKKELKKFIKFTNNDLGGQTFVHPVVKSIMIHFWIAYLHPFTDGNGRLARLLFYWYLIREGYWAFVYLPISKIIKLSPAQYTMAYVYSEQDDNDLTYFIDYNVKKIKLAVADFKKYLNKRSVGNVRMKKRGEVRYGLNIRQVQLLQFMQGDREERTSLRVHMNINQVSKRTASKDLKGLVGKGFLSRDKQGRNVYYYGTEKIRELF